MKDPLLYSIYELLNYYYPLVIGILFFTGGIIGMSPLKNSDTDNFFNYTQVFIRKIIIYTTILMVVALGLVYCIFTFKNSINDQFWPWIAYLVRKSLFVGFAALLISVPLRLMFKRYIYPKFSLFIRSIRISQDQEIPTDIRYDSKTLKQKDFLPSSYYSENQIFFGLDQNDNPIYIPVETWREVNMQVIGATRYGKGIIFGSLMEQGIRNGDTIIYIDPKDDKFAPHIMYQAAMSAGRKFCYISMDSDECGAWHPFTGGSFDDGFSRLETAFGLKLTGDPGTDYYKSQELMLLTQAFKKDRTIKGLLSLLESTEANRILAELNKMSSISSLNPKNKKGSFSLEKAILENYVVYFKGSLTNESIRVATKIFIIEITQQAKRLVNLRKNHLSCFVDEVSVLASQDLARALATMLGFNVNFALAYQSPNDIVNTDDKTINGRAISQSINTNCQLKALYGGADIETAEWIAQTSGTIQKNVIKMEKTDLSELGGETFEGQRTIGMVEENLININTILTLPPRICVLLRPRHIAEICHTSFVPISDFSQLNDYKDRKKPKIVKSNLDENTTDDSVVMGVDSELEDIEQPNNLLVDENSSNGFHQFDSKSEDSIDKNLEKNDFMALKSPPRHPVLSDLKSSHLIRDDELINQVSFDDTDQL